MSIKEILTACENIAAKSGLVFLDESHGGTLDLEFYYKDGERAFAYAVLGGLEFPQSITQESLDLIQLNVCYKAKIKKINNE